MSLEHVYVVAWLPYFSYRGIGSGTGQKIWVTLDPSFKDYQKTVKLDLSKVAASFKKDEYLKSDTSELPVDIWRDGLRQYMKENNLICETFDDITVKREIVPDNMTLLPCKLRGKRIAILGTYSSVPDELRDWVTFSITGDSSFQYKTNIAQLHGKKVDLTYPPATAEDKAIIDSYGDLYSTPSYLIKLRPVLRIGNEVVAAGSPVSPGQDQELKLDFQTLTWGSDRISHTVTAGSLNVFVLVPWKISDRLFNERMERLKGLEAKGDDSDEIELESLNIAGLKYFRNLNRVDREVMGVFQYTQLKDTYEGIASRRVLRDREVLGYALTIRPGAYFIDIPRIVSGELPMDGDHSDNINLRELTGYTHSALEHSIWEEMIGEDSVSAVKALQIAYQEGQKIYEIDKSNVNDIIPMLNLPQRVKDDIANGVNRGDIATVSKDKIQLNQWDGVGYIIFDPIYGTGAYYIDGSLTGRSSGNGGSSTGGGDGVGGDSGLGGGLAARLEELLDRLRAIIDQDSVNITNGNRVYFNPDLTVMARGIPIAFVRHYNSRSTRDSDIGYGWTHTYNQRIIEKQDGSLTYIREDGKEHEIAFEGGVYIPPKGEYFTIAKTISGYTLVQKSGEILEFNQNGYLIAMEDLNGNRVDIIRNGSDRIQKLIDAAGRDILIFSYNLEGRISQISDIAFRVVKFEYDEYGNLISVTDPLGNFTKFSYYLDHNLASITDPLGNIDRYFYDNKDRMYRHVDSKGNEDLVFYDPYHGKTLATDSMGNDTIYTIDSDGNVTEEIDAIGNVRSVTYDENHNRLTETDHLGNTITRTYDEEGNMLTETDARLSTTTFTYNQYGQVISQTDPLLKTITNEYDERGNLTSTVDKSGQVTEFGYDINGQLLTQTVINGVESYTTTYSYDDGGNMTTQTDPLNNTTQYEYTLSGQLTKTTDPEGGITETIVDDLGRPVDIVRPDGASTKIEYDANGNRTAIINPQGQRTSFEYDELGRIIHTVDPHGYRTTIQYDSEGNVIEREDQRGNSTRFEYNAIHRIIKRIDAEGNVYDYDFCADEPRPCDIIDANGNVLHKEWDESGNLVLIRDALGNETKYEYDSLNRKITEIDAEGNITQFEYDARDRLTAVIDALGNRTEYSYEESCCQASIIKDANGNVTGFALDPLGRVSKETDPLGLETMMTYDGVGNIKTKLDPNGNTITYNYDVARRPTAITYPDGSTTSFEYDLYGNKARESNSDVALAYGYDEQNRLISVTNETLGKTIHYTYNELGQRHTMTDAEGVITKYHYDKLNRLSAIENPNSEITNYLYDPMGRRTKKVLPNGAYTEYSYDAGYRMTLLVNKKSNGDIISAYTYSYDRVGNRTSMTDHNGATTKYTYDALYRLTRVDYGNGNIETFSYDNVGNRLTKTLNGTVTNYSYNAGNRLLSKTKGAQVTNYIYDNNGNLTSKDGPYGTDSYTYNYENRLIQASTADGDILSFGYNQSGIRTFKTHNGTRTNYLLDGKSVIGDYDNTGALQIRYNLGERTDEIISQVSNSVTKYFTYDGLGSITGLLDTTQVLVGTSEYDAFGKVIGQTGEQSRFGYTGREWESALQAYYNRARYYMPAIGRFLTQDTYRGEYVSPPSLHRYVYVQNNPVNYTDPSGEFAFAAAILLLIKIIAFAIVVINVAIALYFFLFAYCVGWICVLLIHCIDLTYLLLFKKELNLTERCVKWCCRTFRIC